MREHDRERHELLGLGARVPEHHPLVARAEAVERIVVAALHLVGGLDAERDVRRLLVERHHDAAGVGVEAVLGAVVADPLDGLADEPRDLHVGLRRDLAGDDDEPGRHERLARNAPVRVVCQDCVEDRVRDLVRDLVRVTLGDRLGREEKFARHDPKRLLNRKQSDELGDVAVALAVEH